MNAVCKWMAGTKRDSINHVLSLDADDGELKEYRRTFASPKWNVIVNKNATMVDALNACLSEVGDGIVMTLFDDMEPDEGWQEKLNMAYRAGKLIAIDCGVTLQTVCCGCATVFKRWGYVYYPGYLSMYADNDYEEHGRQDNLFVQSDMWVKHKHYTTGEADIDETYKRQNSNVAYEHGQRILTARRVRQFAW